MNRSRQIASTIQQCCGGSEEKYSWTSYEVFSPAECSLCCALSLSLLFFREFWYLNTPNHWNESSSIGPSTYCEDGNYRNKRERINYCSLWHFIDQQLSQSLNLSDKEKEHGTKSVCVCSWRELRRGPKSCVWLLWFIKTQLLLTWDCAAGF